MIMAHFHLRPVGLSVVFEIEHSFIHLRNLISVERVCVIESTVTI
jgi:hypothetical protein